MRSYSARLIVCLSVLVESSTMKVERVLRASTRAFTATLPNSVFWLFGISSVSSRSRSAGGFHSVVAAFSSYATTAPPSWARHPLDAGRDATGSRHRGIPGVYPDIAGSIIPGQSGALAPMDPGGRREKGVRRGRGQCLSPARRPTARETRVWFRPIAYPNAWQKGGGQIAEWAWNPRI